MRSNGPSVPWQVEERGGGPLTMAKSEKVDVPPSIVAIHQPNYAPWLGYFCKIAHGDMFIFLDDVQYSKNSYTNRTRIAGSGAVRWLTQPVRRRFGEPICDICFAGEGWPVAHLDVLRGRYREAACYRDVWDTVVSMYEEIPPDGSLAATNQFIVETLTRNIGLDCVFLRSSDYPVGDLRADDRLIALVRAVAPGAVYLSGLGGARYQDGEKFVAADVTLSYVSFDHPEYSCGTSEFHPGLSVLDAVFHLGWSGTRALIVDRIEGNTLARR